MPQKLFLTSAEVDYILGRSDWTRARYVRQGLFPKAAIGGAQRNKWLVGEVEVWLKQPPKFFGGRYIQECEQRLAEVLLGPEKVKRLKEYLNEKYGDNQEDGKQEDLTD